ncbi:hypothetical protein SEA_MICULUCIGAS_41 [Mycobacterium Phage MiculUcigas]|nr:hypothetical protein SEA_MICULUCIGAS_41 [Mycobacterium Phage MiculUcigas]
MIEPGVYVEVVYGGQRLSHKALIRDVPVIGAVDRDLVALQLIDYSLDQVVHEVKTALRRMERG